MPMQCLLVYDIPDDGKRAKIADVCLDYGLDRIQYSAFLGPLLPTHQEELMLKLKKVLGKRPGNIQLFPLCRTDWEARRVLVQREGEMPAGGGDA
ncbi:MAG: CRISPR-associated endonuclease Cas2 [Anaerolineales bacterium]